MIKRNLLLINCWVVFITIAAFGKTVSLYQDFSSAPDINLSFSPLLKASQNMSEIKENFVNRTSIQEIASQKSAIDTEIEAVEKKLAAKPKPRPQVVNFAKATKPVLKKQKTVVTNTQVVMNNKELFTIDNMHPVKELPFKTNKVKIFKTVSLLNNVKVESVLAIAAQADVNDLDEYITVTEVSNDTETKDVPQIGKADEVKVGQAAPIRSRVPEQQTDNAEIVTNELSSSLASAPISSSDDEPIFIDYSSNNKDTPEANVSFPTNAKLSSTVEKAIARELKQPIVNAPVVARELDDGQKYEDAKAEENTQNKAQQPLMPIVSQVSSQKETVEVAQFAPEMTSQKREAKFSLTAFKVELNKGRGENLNNFEYEPSYDSVERVYDQGSATVNLSFNLSSDLAVVDGKIVSRETVKTRAILSGGDGAQDFNVPVITMASLEKFLSDEKLRGNGGFLLIDTQNGIQQTLMDLDFEKSYFLDENFKKTTDAQAARYHFYVGVTPGNALVTYQFKNGKQAQRVAFIGLDEVTFDSAEFFDENVKKLALYEQKLFGSELSDLQVSPTDFRYFNTKNIAQVQGLNFYEISRPALPLGMREYFEIGGKDDAIFMGGWNVKNLEVPSTDFRNAALEALGLNGIGENCVVQLNFHKKIKSLKVAAETGGGPMNIGQTYLDKSGEFSSEYSEMTTRAFFRGNEQGVINYRVDYFDDTTDTFQTFCSLGSYLVEQL